MPTSQAKIDANRKNSLLSTGPTSTFGKERSRRNSFKGKGAGAGVVVAEEDVAEIEKRAEEFANDLAPKSAIGKFLTRQLAVHSMRIDNSAKQEGLATAYRTRHAVEEFDRARREAADRLLDALGEAPRVNLRRLLGTPEGVERLIEAWQRLRDDLTREGRPAWTVWHRERAENLTGVRIEDARGSEFEAWSNTLWDQAAGILEPETRAEIAQKKDARARLIERIDREIAELEEFYETLDFETLELDRAEAPGRALFDASHEATLARRYEAENTRKFFKTLDQIRRVEAEAAERPPSPPPSPATPTPPKTYAPVASFRDRPSSDSFDRIHEFESILDEAGPIGPTAVRGPESRPMAPSGPA